LKGTPFQGLSLTLTAGPDFKRPRPDSSIWVHNLEVYLTMTIGLLVAQVGAIATSLWQRQVNFLTSGHTLKGVALKAPLL